MRKFIQPHTKRIIRRLLDNRLSYRKIAELLNRKTGSKFSFNDIGYLATHQIKLMNKRKFFALSTIQEKQKK
jgi:hypothetical protein